MLPSDLYDVAATPAVAILPEGCAKSHNTCRANPAAQEREAEQPAVTRKAGHSGNEGHFLGFPFICLIKYVYSVFESFEENAA